MKDLFKGVALLLGGAALGAAVALLVTPKTGEEVRNELKDLAEEAKKQVIDLAEEAKKQVKDFCAKQKNEK